MKGIKLRVWSTRKQKWHHKLLEWFCGNSKGSIGELPLLPDDAIVSEFTDMEDKNGKEIYVGDIVKINESNWIAEVVKSIDGFDCKDKVGKFLTCCQWNKFEVIGNIYKNPELVKKYLSKRKKKRKGKL